MMDISTEKYRRNARKGLENRVLQKALYNLQVRFGRGTAEAYRKLPEGPELRLEGHRMRAEAIDNLDILLERLTENIRRRGGQVYFAEDAAAAVNYCLDLARTRNVRRVVKGKSMVTEEIGLNEALIGAGLDVAETDLGEFIIQLAGEHPSHIIAPAIHKTRKDIGKLFVEKLGIAYTDDPPILTRAARKALREKFLSADMGITGCNLACAETGHITTLSNEGNIRMTTTLPRLQVVFMGMERITARLEDHDALLRLLARGAAAQHMAGYVSYIGGPRQPWEIDGPEEFHLVILDNGRSRMLADPRFREMLYCIRCAACLNVCPVYGKIGGHAYGFTYSGPVGAVVTPLMVGPNRAADLCRGETLCEACRDACPVNIDLPRMLLELRAMLAEGDKTWGVQRTSPLEKMFYGLWAFLVTHPRLYGLAQKATFWGAKLMPRHDGRIRKLPPGMDGWTVSRDLPEPAAESFRELWKRSSSNREMST